MITKLNKKGQVYKELIQTTNMKKSKLAITAFVLSMFILFLFLLSIMGISSSIIILTEIVAGILAIIFGVISIIQIKKNKNISGLGLAIIAIVVSLLAIIFLLIPLMYFAAFKPPLPPPI